MKSILFLALVLLVFATTANVYTSGPRLDSGDDATQEEHDCWVDGYDSGFDGGSIDNNCTDFIAN